MPSWKITAPDGHSYKVTGDDLDTHEAAVAAWEAQSKTADPSQPVETSEPKPFSEPPTGIFQRHPQGGVEFAQGILATPGRLVKSLAQMAGMKQSPEFLEMASSTPDTGSGTAGRIVGDVAATAALPFGAVQKFVAPLQAAKGVLPAIGRTADIAATQGAVGAALSPDQQAEGAAWSAGGGAAVPVLSKALKVLGAGTAHALGVTTGAGGRSVQEAFRDAPGFVENMRGKVPAADVVEQAKSGLQSMRQQMYDAYANAKGGWASDKRLLSLAPIQQAADDAGRKFSFGNTPQPGTEDVRKQVQGIIDHWYAERRTNPAYGTVAGLDALKRHLQDVIPDNIANRTGRAYVTEVVNSVKEAITKQVPEYADAMKDYWSRSGQLDEIGKQLSLGDKASVDTALRKLQSLMRNNVNTNYGARLQSADALAQQGGQDVLPAVAGQALSSWVPRGIQQAVAGGAGTLGVASGVVSLPAAIGAALVQSPRLVGSAARGMGNTYRNPTTQALIEALRRSAPVAARSLETSSGGN